MKYSNIIEVTSWKYVSVFLCVSIILNVKERPMNSTKEGGLTEILGYHQLDGITMNYNELP